MKRKTKYRLSRYRYKSWQIEEWQYNKKKRAWEWRPIKYPGRIIDAVEGMVDLGFGDFTTDNLRELIDKLDEITYRLSQHLELVDELEFEHGD